MKNIMIKVGNRKFGISIVVIAGEAVVLLVLERLILVLGIALYDSVSLMK